MAFGQQSLRVSDPGHDAIRLPEVLFDGKHEKMMEKTKKVLSKLKPLYYELISDGVPPEQARAVLPIGITTKIVVTMTLRDMIDYFRGRTGPIAQGEHTYLANLMLEELKGKSRKFYDLVMLMGGRK
jgi:thymidylate synthase ThyX